MRRERHEPDRRAKADDVVEVAGVAERAPVVAAVGERQHPGSQCRARAAARAAGALRRVVRVERPPVHRVVRMRSHPELGHVRLADRNHARAAQPLDDDRVLGRHEVAEDRRAEGHRKADGGLEVLERERQAVQRPDLIARRDPPVGVVGQRQARVVVELRDDGVERRVQALDPPQMRRHYLARRELPLADEPRQLARAAEAEIVAVGGRGHRAWGLLGPLFPFIERPWRYTPRRSRSKR